MGVAMLPRPSAYLHKGLIRLPIDTRGAYREIWLVVREELRNSRVIKAVMDFLEEAINKPFRQPPL